MKIKENWQFFRNTGSGTLGEEVVGDYYFASGSVVANPFLRIRHISDKGGDRFEIFLDEEMVDVNGAAWVESEDRGHFDNFKAAAKYAEAISPKPIKLAGLPGNFAEGRNKE